MTQINLVLPIVGAHFRPPAKAIVQILRVDQPIYLVREPDNEYDPNAVKVVWKSSDLHPDDEETLTGQAAGYGFDAEMIKNVEEWHLGYLPAVYMSIYANLFPSTPLQGKVSFTPEGKTAVSFTLG